MMKFFVEIKENDKQVFLVTWVTHNSRVSERMIVYGVERGEPVFLEEEDEVIVTKAIHDIVKDDDLCVLAYNICCDHIHMVLICSEGDLSNIVRKLKGKSAQKYKDILEISAKEVFHLWAQKFHRSSLETDESLASAILYVNLNRGKHSLVVNKGLQPLVKSMVCEYDDSLF